MKILVLVGGTNEPSNSNVLADAFIEGMQSISGIETEKVRLKDLHIEHFHLDHYDMTRGQEPDMERVERLFQESAGVVFATPIWNFGVPGNVKNLIDRLGRTGLDAGTRSVGTFKGKPTFLVFTGGTPPGAWRPLQKKTTSHLPVALRYFGCTVIGSHYEARCTPGKGKFALVVDQRPGSLEKMREFGKHFAGVAKTHATTGKLPAREAFLLWFFQFGQKLKRKLGL